MPTTINRLTAEVHVPAASDGIRAQDQAAAFVKSSLIPAVERVTQKLDVGGRTIRIDKLELDFLRFSPDGDNSLALLQFEQQLEEKLALLIQQAAKNTEQELLSEDQNTEELFFYLLLNGNLPWWASSSNTSLQALAENIIQQSSQTFFTRLLNVFNQAAARQRAARQLSTTIKEKFLQLINPESEKLLAIVKKLSSAVPLAEPLFWQTALRPGTNTLTSADFLQNVLNSRSNIPETILAKLKQVLTDSKIAPAKLPQIKENTEEFEMPPNTGEEKHHVLNAGLVILAPFLPQFFKQLGLTKENEFIDLHSRQRAVCLLQYLATGVNDNFEEHHLVFNKVFCGHAIYLPIDLPFKANQKEIEECDELLNSVAQNWTALKGTSARGMRNAFFMRNAIIEQQGHGWNLKIERQTIDILIDRLPWGISIIKTPWNKDAIFVDWT